MDDGGIQMGSVIIMYLHTKNSSSSFIYFLYLNEWGISQMWNETKIGIPLALVSSNYSQNDYINLKLSTKTFVSYSNVYRNYTIVMASASGGVLDKGKHCYSVLKFKLFFVD